MGLGDPTVTQYPIDSNWSVVEVGRTLQVNLKQNEVEFIRKKINEVSVFGTS